MSAPSDAAVPAIAHLIEGELVAGAGEDPVLDPSSGAELTRAPSADAALVERAVQAARRAAPGWAATPPGERAAALLALADAIEARSEQFAAIESLDVGKPIRAAREELAEIVDSLRFFAGAGRCLPGTAVGEYRRSHTSMLRREPLGVVGLLTPWNYPLMTACWKLGAALTAGNAVVLKPSETTPLSAALLADVARELLPAGVLNVVFGRGAVAGRALVGNPAVAMVSLTGGTATGRAVARAAGDTLQRVTLELGGNAPAVVLDDADLDATAEGLVAAAFANAGQDCTAAARVIADAWIAEELTDRLATKAQALRVGLPHEEATELGPLVSEVHRTHVASLLRDGLADGRVRCGGRVPDRDGWYLEPTVVDGIGADAPLVREEIFGPVITVQAVAGAAAAVEAANAVSQALAASVWSRDGERALEAARRLDCGVVWVNDHMVFASEMPHGGRADSGYGSDLSLDAVLDFTTPKHVMVRLASGERFANPNRKEL